MIDLKIREATLQDSEIYLLWRNDPVVRESAFNTSAISLVMHQNWFSNKIESELSKLYMLFENEVPVGQVRFDIHENVMEAEINYSIDESFRGKRIATPLMQKAIDTIFFANKELNKLVAKVKLENTASNRVFEKLNFEKIIQPDISMNVFEYTQKSK